MTTWQYARLIVHPVPYNDGTRTHNYWFAIMLGPDDRAVDLGQFDAQSDPSQDPWKLNRWHLRLLNQTGSDGWELMYIQSYEGDITTYLSAQIPAIERTWANGPTSPRAKYSPGDVAQGAEAELWVEQLQELCRGSRPGIGDCQVEARHMAGVGPEGGAGIGAHR